MNHASTFRRVALFNDTGRSQHVGCRAVTAAHDLMLKRAGFEISVRGFLGEWENLWQGDRKASLQAFHRSKLARDLKEVGAVIVNGEGTIHHGFGMHLVTILGGAQEMGLPTFLVNAVIQECEQDLQTLRQLNDFTVRDAASSEYLKRLGISHRIVLDSLLECPFVSNPVHDFRNKIVITDWHPARQNDIGNALQKVLAGLDTDAVFYPLDHPEREQDWQHALADFSQAGLVITARHHGVCLAGLAGVPFVALGSNTWKVEGMLKLLPGNLTVCSDLSELVTRAQDALARPEIFKEVQKFLQLQRPLSTFRMLEKSQKQPAGPIHMNTNASKLFQGVSLPVRLNGTQPTAPAQKICLASCFLPLDDENCKWWKAFQDALYHQGMELVLLSSAPAADLQLRTIVLPTWMQGFMQAYGTTASKISLEDSLVAALAERERAWTKQENLDVAEFKHGLNECQRILRSVLAEIQPSSVLVWGTILPQSVVLQQLAMQQGIPCWVIERGLLPDTLMIEMIGQVGLSELNRSFTLNQVARRSTETVLFDAARKTYLENYKTKYAQAEFLNGDAFRARFNPEGKKLIAALLQYDTASNLVPSNHLGARIHTTCFESSAAVIKQLATAAAEENCLVIVKPHPLDPDDYSSLQSANLAIVRDVNLHSLIQNADVVAAMTSSTQFEALLYEKPILLLARSPLANKGIAYQPGSCEDLPRMLAAALQRKDFENRMVNGRRFIHFLLENFSIALSDKSHAGATLTDLAAFVADNSIAIDAISSGNERLHSLGEVLKRFESFCKNQNPREMLRQASSVPHADSSLVPGVEFVRGPHLLEVFRVPNRQVFKALWKERFERMLREQDLLLPPKGNTQPYQLTGLCSVCKREQAFTTDFMFSKPDAEGRVRPSWRERQICRCGLNCRQRSSFHILTHALNLTGDSLIYCTEQQGTLFNHIRQEFPHTVGSEYLGNQFPLGSTSPEGLRNEDITQLTYPDASFDCIFSLDVMEHVPNYKAGFREMARCLKPKGKLLLTAPFHFHQEKTVIRSTVNPDGTLTHHLPEVYHGDPINAKGALCFNDFGWDIIDDLREVGFADATIFIFTAPHYGYVGFQYVILATRHPVGAQHIAPAVFPLPQSTQAFQQTRPSRPELPRTATELRSQATELFNSGKCAEAMRHFQRLTQLASNDLSGWRGRIACAKAMGYETLERLIREEALEIHPEWAADLDAQSENDEKSTQSEIVELVEGRTYGD